MAGTTSRMGRFYTEKRAAAELRTYKEKGPRPAARILIEALRAEGVEGASLLDIGGGIGATGMKALRGAEAYASQRLRAANAM
jgi:hypothetical protein